jgi:hypothetical protein
MSNLNYKFELEDKYIYVNDNNDKYVIKSPYLKVLKAKHEFKNKNYLIVQLDQDLDIDEQIDNFIKKIRAIDEYSKDILLNNSKNWYGKKWDIYTLDSMTRYPIDEQKGLLYMKIIINKEDKELNKSIETLEKILENNKEVYISIETYFKGLRWSREIFTEEWYLKDFSILEEENEDLIIENLIKNIEEKNISKSEEKENNIIENNENNIIENEENKIEIEENEENKIEIQENEENKIEIQENNQYKEEYIENIEYVENVEKINEFISNNIENKNHKKNKNKKIEKEDDKSVFSTTSSKVKKRFILNGKLIK